MTHDHPIAYGLAAGVSLLMAILGSAFTFGAPDSARKLKLVLWNTVMMWSTLVFGALALEVTWWHRADGVRVLFGRWVWLAGVVPLVITHMSVSFGNDWFVTKWAVAMAILLGLCYPAMSITESTFGHGAQDGLIFFLVFGLIGLLSLCILLCLAGSRVIMWLRPSEARSGAGIKDNSDGSAVSLAMWIPLLASILMCLVFALFFMLLSLGNEGFRTYTDEGMQTWLTIGLTMVGALIFSLIHVLVNPDAGFSFTWGALFTRGNANGDVTLGFGSVADGDETPLMVPQTGNRMDKSKKSRKNRPMPGSIGYGDDGAEYVRTKDNAWVPTGRFATTTKTSDAVASAASGSGTTAEDADY